jgi:uncharacterized membrane protein YebE (DUF533 family)
MGFFANLFGDSSQRELELSRQEAFLGLMLCAAACDGVVSEAERQAIFTITERMKLFENISPHRWSHLTNQLIDLLQRDGQARFMMNCAESLPESLRDCVFANACDIILADSVVEPEEKRFLDALQHELQLDSRTARAIVDVMITKNKG